MKLDNDLLKNMIAETISELFNEATQEQVAATQQAAQAAKQAAQAAKQTAEAAKVQADETAEEAAAKQAAEEAAKAAKAGPLGESFQLTKGRLRQIIAEELASAKKQGIL